MRRERINFYIGIILLTIVIVSSACSFSRINAQSPETARRTEAKPEESPTPAYKKPKRVSKDVISEPEKPETPKKAKTK